MLLTPRQRELAELLLQGMKSSAIARKMHFSRSNEYRLLKSIAAKLHIETDRVVVAMMLHHRRRELHVRCRFCKEM